MYFTADYLTEDKNNEIDSIWSGRRGALTANWSRYKREGLVDECCLKPCTTDVILNYCWTNDLNILCTTM